MAELLPATAPVTAPEDCLQELANALDSGAFLAAVQARDFGTALERAAQAVNQHHSHLAELEQMADWLHLLAAHLKPADRDVFNQALDGLKNASRPFEGVLDSRERLQAVPNAMELAMVYAQQIRDRLREVWGRYLKSEFSSRVGLAKVLQRFPQHAELGRSMGKTAKDALNLESRFPSSSARQSLEQYGRERDGQIQELERSGTAEKTLEFLLRVAEGKATLAHLDGEILHWLAVQGALELFHLSLPD